MIAGDPTGLVGRVREFPLVVHALVHDLRARDALRAEPGAPRGYLVMFEWWRLLAGVRASAGRRALLATAADLDRLGGPGTAPAALGAAERGEAARHAASAAAPFDALDMPVDAATVRIEAAERGGARDGLAAD